MNKSLLKFVTDFGPLLVFLLFYYNGGKNLKIAIPPFIVATILALIVVWILEKKIPMIPLIGGILITLFGGLTIYFDNPIFLYIKPTIINILFGLTLLLADEGWKILNNRWMYFFFSLALINEIVWRTQSEEFWVNFKVWGLLPITFVFSGFQIPLINKYKINE